MEAKRVIACAMLMWVAGYIGLGALRAEAPGAHAVALRALRLAQRWLSSLGSSELVYRLLQVGCIERVCRAASRWAAGHGNALAVGECCAALVLSVFVTVPLGVLASQSVLGAAVVLVAWLAGIPLLDSSLTQKRAQGLSEQMPGVFRTLAMAMGSGETLAQAVEYVGDHEGGVAGAAFRSAALKLRCGFTAQEALESLVDELDAPGVELIATALLISQRTGSPLRGLFQRSATLVERQGEFERMLAVKTAQVRLSVRIVSLLPVVMVATLSMISPDFQKGVATAPGAISLLVAASMDLFALGIIRHMLRGVL